MKKIPLIEYARGLGLHPSTVTRKATNGGYKSAEKIGRDWFIDPDEPHLDGRVKSGKYKGWRKKHGKKNKKENNN